MKPQLLAPLLFAKCSACRAMLPPGPPRNGPFSALPVGACPADTFWLYWLGAGLLLGICLSWLIRRLLLKKGLEADRAEAGSEELELAQKAQDSTEKILRSLPQKDVVVKFSRKSKEKKDRRI